MLVPIYSTNLRAKGGFAQEDAGVAKGKEEVSVAIIVSFVGMLATSVISAQGRAEGAIIQ